MRGSGKRTRTFRSRFRVSSWLALGLGLILTTSMLAGLLLLSRVTARMREEVAGRTRLVTTTLANDINTFLNGYKLALGLLGRADFWNQAGVDAVERSYPAFGAVMTVDDAGRVSFASASSSESGHDVSMRDFHIETKRTRLPYLSSTFITEGDYASTVVLAVPHDGGMAVGYLKLETLNEYISSLSVPDTVSVAVVDRNGYFVASADPRRIIERDSVALEDWFKAELLEVVGSTLVDGDDGGIDLVSWSPVGQNSGWTIVVTEPARHAFMGVTEVRFAMSIVLILVWLLSMALMAIVLYFFDTDIRSLRRYSATMASGAYESEFGYAGFKDLAPLAEDYGRAAQAVRDREERLRESRQRLERLLDFMPVPAVIIDGDGSIQLFNKAMIGLLGWTTDEIRNTDDWWPRVYPDEAYRATVIEYWEAYLAALRSGGQMPPFEGPIARKDGSTRIVVGEAAIIGTSIVTVFIDVSSARESEALMAASLREKEILLKEIHHRVKNNLQLVISLLTLKSNSAGGREDAFTESIDRIRVMATIHELLYESKDFSHIDLGEYITTIVEWILSSYAYGPDAPRLRLDLSEIELDIDSAVPCGLIINELFTNAIKYAFGPDTPLPTISVSTSISPGGLISLAVSDNGRGVPASIDPKTVETLGMQLITSLTDQLHGTWTLERNGGSTWTIAFPRQTAAGI